MLDLVTINVQGLRENSGIPTTGEDPRLQSTKVFAKVQEAKRDTGEQEIEEGDANVQSSKDFVNVKGLKESMIH